MKRLFFGSSKEVTDTKGNRMFGDVLSRVESTLVDAFGVPVGTFGDFIEWSVFAKQNRPEMGYLLEWMKYDINICRWCDFDISEYISDSLADELDVAIIILNNLKLKDEPTVFCSDIADLLDSVAYALKQDDVPCVESPLTEAVASFTDVYSLMVVAGIYDIKIDNKKIASSNEEALLVA